MKKHKSMKSKAQSHNCVLLFLISLLYLVLGEFPELDMKLNLLIYGVSLFFFQKNLIRIPIKKKPILNTKSKRITRFLITDFLIFTFIMLVIRSYDIKTILLTLFCSSLVSYVAIKLLFNESPKRIHAAITLALLPAFALFCSVGALAIGIYNSDKLEASNNFVISHFNNARSVASIDASNVKILTKKMDPSTFTRVGILKLEKINGKKTMVMINKDRLDVDFLKKERLKCSNHGQKNICFPESYYEDSDEFVKVNGKFHTTMYMLKSFVRVFTR